MTTKVDGRPYHVDVAAHLDRDAPRILISGLASGWLTGATVTAPIRSRLTTTEVEAWACDVDATAGTIELSLTQAEAAALGAGAYDWVLLITLANGGKPALLAGTLRLHRVGRPSRTAFSAVQVTLSDTGAEFTIEQVVSDSVTALDGGTASGTGSDTIDGGDA